MKILSLISIALLSLSLTACGNQGEKDKCAQDSSKTECQAGNDS